MNYISILLIGFFFVLRELAEAPIPLVVRLGDSRIRLGGRGLAISKYCRQTVKSPLWLQMSVFQKKKNTLLT